MHEITKPCPVCGSRMIVRYTGEARPSQPPVYVHRWYCGVHGDQGDPVYMREATVQRHVFQRWQDAQQAEE